MPMPFRRLSKTRGRKRRTHYKASEPTTTSCHECGATIKPHHVCKECGFYKGKKVVKSKHD